MTTQPHRPTSRETPRATAAGFTLMEVLLALFVFGMAVVALVEVINSAGLLAVESRMMRRVHLRMDALLLEATRHPQAFEGRPGQPLAHRIEEAGATYHITTALVELSNDDGQPITDIWAATVTAKWLDSGQMQEEQVETWFWPPLFNPPNP